jgi:cytochrome c oxidase subunit 2
MKHLKHFVFVAILVALLTAGVGFGLQNVRLFPPAASLQADPIDSLFDIHIWAIAFLFSLIIGFMLYSVVVFRRRKGDTSDGDYIEGNTGLELIWTFIPLVVVIYFAYLGGESLAATRMVDPNAMRVNVTGRQWSWTFEYPELGIVSNQLVLPVNEQVLLRLRSEDVLHSFWVPEFRVKQDLLPGDLVRDLRITPDLIGDYKVRCAELCGRQHSLMLADVIVMSEADYDIWVQEMLAGDPAESDDPVVRGQAWAERSGCKSCHSFDGTPGGVGPTWAGIWGTEEQMSDGSTIVVDVDYIYESIRNPGARIVAGYENNMPANIGEDLTDEQIADITAFIESLK